jgi:transposase
MAVRGLGCPVRFVLTAGQKGDAPQADLLIEELPAEVVMGDTAYDGDRLRKLTRRQRRSSPLRAHLKRLR